MRKNKNKKRRRRKNKGSRGLHGRSTSTSNVPCPLPDLWISLLLAGRGRLHRDGLGPPPRSAERRGGGGRLSKLKLAARLHFMSKFLRAHKNPNSRTGHPYIHPSPNLSATHRVLLLDGR